jgi:hypothetical protein
MMLYGVSQLIPWLIICYDGRGAKWLRNGSLLVLEGLDSNSEEVTRQQRINMFSANVQVDLYVLDNYSSLSRLQRVTAWHIRFIKNCRMAHHDEVKWYLTVKELH